MLRLIRSQLQARLILAFILVMLIPTGFVSAYNLFRTRETLLRQISSEQLRVAEARAATAESRIVQGGGDLLFVVMDAALRRYGRGEARTDEVSTAFQTFLQQSLGRYSGLCLLNPSGVEVVCVRQGADNHFRRVAAGQLHDRRDEPAFVNALRQAGIPDGNMVAITGSDSADPPAQVLCYSILYPDEQGAPAGVLVLEAPLAPLLAVLVDSAPGVRTSVLDSDGTYLYHPGLDHADRKRHSVSEEQPHDAQIILRQAAGTIIDSPDRPASFQVFTRVRVHSQSTMQWTVIYEQSYADALASVGETQVVLIAISSIAMVSATLLAIVLAGSIVRPVKELAAAAERIGGGELATPIPHVGHDEIGALSDTIERMVVRMRDALVAAESRRNEAETLRAATQSIGATLDLDRVLMLILTELRKVVPFDSASVQEVQGSLARIISTYGLASAKQMLGSTFSLLPGASPNAEVARTGLPVMLANSAHDARFNNNQWHSKLSRSWLGVPMIFGEQLIGMITLDKHEAGFYTAAHARLALAFAAQAAAAMENARLYAAARRELTDRRRAEAAQARLATIIEATTDLVSMADPTGRLIFMNQAGRRLLGLTDAAPLEGIQVTTFFPAQLHAWLSDEVLPTVLRAGVWSGETQLLARDGSEIPVSQVIIAHKSSDGQVELVSTIARDMRERRHAEAELRQAQKMEALGRLAGGVAHDFNNLLTVILGEADMLLEDIPSGHEWRDSVTQIRQSGTRAAALTRQLLVFSRRQVLQPELVNLNQVLADMEQLLYRLIGEDIVLTITLAADLPMVRADQGQIEQVVMNLVINARDAMPDGGQLQIETLSSRLDEASVRAEDGAGSGAYAQIVVSDTGLGMDEPTKAQLFEPFFTTKPRGKGTGLGLATVHGIVRQSGGLIRFQSALGQGTTFMISLPAAEPLPDQPQLPVQPEMPRLSRTNTATVLLVEDDNGVRRLACQILTHHGFTVIEASDGPSALALARAYASPISVLLTDVIMPGGLNGVQLATILRGERPDTRVVYMSGYTDNALVEQSLAEAHTSFLQKPFTPDDLVQMLLAALA